MEPSASDKALIEKARRGDRAAFETIVARHQGVVYGYLRARVIQVADAEDLTQEVFLRCYQGRKQLDSSLLVRPWLIGIARNLLREYVRKRKRRKEVNWTELCLELDECAGSEDGMYDDVLGFLPGCLASLGSSAREAIQLRYAAKMRLAEIGNKLRRSEGAVKLLMFRARQALRHCIVGKRRLETDD